MSEKKLDPLARFFFCATLVTMLVQNVWGQVAAPPPVNPALPSSTAAPEQKPKPRPPTPQDVAQLKAAEDWPGSILWWVAIVGNFVYAGFVKGPIGDDMLAANTSGRWAKITDDVGGSADTMVQFAPSMPRPLAQALIEQARLNEVYWTGNAPAPELDRKVAAYGDYDMQGYNAANRGDFDAAIAAWKKAAAIDSAT
jgi:hypothetical protein